MIAAISNEYITAKINTLGAELVSLTGHDEVEYLWTGNPDFWNGQAPILFPTVGRLKDKKAVIGGAEYAMGVHGFARKSEFTLISNTRDEAVFSLKSGEETKKMYPYDFELLVTYALNGLTLETRMEVTNLSNADMLYGIGGHPGFNVPLYSGEVFEDYQLVFGKKETIDAPAFTAEEEIDFGSRTRVMTGSNILPLSYDLFASDAIILDKPASTEVAVVHKTGGHGVKMEFSDFPCIAFWTKKDAPYVCLEPWHGIGVCTGETADFAAKRMIIRQEAGVSRSFSYFVTVLKGNDI